MPSLLLGLAFLGGCGESTAAQSVPVDERNGSVQGVSLGDSLAEVKRRLPGGIEADVRTSRTLPLVGDQEELGLPAVIDPPRDGIPLERFGLLRYRHLSISFAPPTGAYVMKIAIPGAGTRAGVAIGDRLDAARTAYPNMRCDVQNRNSEYVPYPYCTTKLKDGLYIWFGQDPIRSITLSSTPL
ncbi:MAG: hypothetical protein M3N47_11700 [Chloroflexota bacterium]|nr:hypothetical protein [Chloroflexota bacterium]